MAIADRRDLYVDSSSLLVWVLGQPGLDDVSSQVSAWLGDGGQVVSSRLLNLELRRVFVRERLAGDEIPPTARGILELVDLLPLTEAVWERAATIEQHVRALDAIHLATCELVAATLLTAGLDHTMCDVAATRGIPTI